MIRTALLTTAFLTSFSCATVAVPAYAHGPGESPGGYGMMAPRYGMGPGNSMMMPGYGMAPGYGMGSGYAMGPGMAMMGPGYGMMYPGNAMAPYMMGPVFQGWAPVKVNLTVDDVRAKFKNWLEWQGNPRLKVGNVKDDGKDTIIAEIVTKDGSLVDRYRVNRSTGAIWRTE